MILRRKRFVHVAVAFPPVTQLHRSAIERVLDAASGDWLRYAPNCWIVWTDLPTRALADQIHAIPGLVDWSFFVTEVSGDHSGYLSHDAWNWMKVTRVP